MGLRQRLRALDERMLGPGGAAPAGRRDELRMPWHYRVAVTVAAVLGYLLYSRVNKVGGLGFLVLLLMVEFAIEARHERRVRLAWHQGADER